MLYNHLAVHPSVAAPPCLFIKNSAGYSSAPRISRSSQARQGGEAKPCAPLRSYKKKKRGCFLRFAGNPGLRLFQLVGCFAASQEATEHVVLAEHVKLSSLL